MAMLLHWHGPSLGAFGAAFAHMRWSWALTAIAFNLLSAAAGSLAWDTVIRQAMPAPRPRYRHVLSAFSIGLLGNIVLPARAGEFARIGVLARRLDPRRRAWATLAGSVVAYRLLDLIPTLGLIAYVLLAAPVPHWALKSLVLTAVLGLALLALGLVSGRRHERGLLETSGTVRRLASTAREGLGILRAPLPAAAASLYQCLAWLAQLFAVAATLHAFRLELPLSAAALVLALVNLAVLFPLWPGNVGLVQATLVLPLAAYGVIDYGRAFAFGVGMQAIEVSVGVSLGLFFLAYEGLSLAVLSRVAGARDVGPRAAARARR